LVTKSSRLFSNSNGNSNTVTQYVIMNVTNAQTQKNGTRNKQSKSK